jgi:uncharacterized protein with HEPN domain
MRRDPRAYLVDVRQASKLITEFTANGDLETYRSDVLLRSAVERQLEIMGEALNRLARTEPRLAERISDLGAIVGFRNVLAHGYDVVDDEVVWRTIEEDLPTLAADVEALIEELPTTEVDLGNG